MARAYGIRTKAALAFEATYGTAPATGYNLMPFASIDLGAAQPLVASELLGLGRDPQAPSRDAITTDGNIVVPIDGANIGHWLKLLFGAPVTTGTSPNYTHTFNSGALTLPSVAIETAFPEVPSYAMATGVRADTFAVDMTRRGNLSATIGLIGQGEALATTSAAGTPASAAVVRLNHFQGAIKRNTVALGNVVGASMTYSNGMAPVETIRADGMIDGVDPTMASMTGNIVSRFADTTLLTQATDGTDCVLEFSWTASANLSLTWTAHSVYLPRPKRPVTGPGGIEARFDWQGAIATSPARLCTVVLKNQVASYA